MARYRGRHAARHAAPRVRRGPSLQGGWTSRPALLSLTIVAAAGTAAVALPSSKAPETVTLRISGTAHAQAEELTATAADDAQRLASEREQLNASRGTARAQIKADAAARAEAITKAAKEAEERLDEEVAQLEIAEQLTSALELEAAQENPQRAARILMSEFGFTGERQWHCLESLWMGESDWRWWVENPTSGAYGIPQSLPADKMASMGEDWRTNPVTQIRWGLDYIKVSYGTPCGAWEFWLAQDPHWY